MESFWNAAAPVLLEFGLLSIITVGIALLTVHTVRRPNRHRLHPARRGMPRFTAVIAVVVLLVSAVITLVGMTEADDPGNGREMMIVGTVLSLIALFLLWSYVITYVETGPEEIAQRGLLGRTRTIRYADITRIYENAPSGARHVAVQSPDGTRISAGIGMVDWDPFHAWRERQESTPPR